MEKLLTIDEYNERIINKLVECAKKSIKDDVEDDIKYNYLETLCKMILTYHVCFKDSVNRLCFEVFCFDKNGKPLFNAEKEAKISKMECKEFNSQPWYKEHFDVERKKYGNTRPYEMLYNPNLLEFMDVVLSPFCVDDLTNQAFEKLYGHEYQCSDGSFFC